jgi:hypothetical protein
MLIDKESATGRDAELVSRAAATSEEALVVAVAVAIVIVIPSMANCDVALRSG